MKNLVRGQVIPVSYINSVYFSTHQIFQVCKRSQFESGYSTFRKTKNVINIIILMTIHKSLYSLRIFKAGWLTSSSANVPTRTSKWFVCTSDIPTFATTFGRLNASLATSWKYSTAINPSKHMFTNKYTYLQVKQQRSRWLRRTGPLELSLPTGYNQEE